MRGAIEFLVRSILGMISREVARRWWRWRWRILQEPEGGDAVLEHVGEVIFFFTEGESEQREQAC